MYPYFGFFPDFFRITFKSFISKIVIIIIADIYSMIFFFQNFSSFRYLQIFDFNNCFIIIRDLMINFFFDFNNCYQNSWWYFFLQKFLSYRIFSKSLISVYSVHEVGLKDLSLVPHIVKRFSNWIYVRKVPIKRI